MLRALWRQLYWYPRDLRLWLRLGLPRRLIYFGGNGYGDTILLHTVAYELRRRGIRTAILSNHPELLRGSPVVSGTLSLQHWRALAAVARFGGQVRHLPYFLQPKPPTHDEPADCHIIAEMCRRAGITGQVALRTYCFLTAAEQRRGALRPQQAVIQALSPTSENISPLKIYPPDRLAAMIQATASDLDWIQVGSPGDPLLPGTLDLRGKTSARETAALLACSRVFVGSPGFVMHLARAVECRSVITFGGRELPRHGGYTCNENLFTSLPCAPCYRRTDSLAGLACMTEITADQLTAAVRRAVARYPEPLAIDTATVTAEPIPFPLPWLTPAAET